MNINIIYLLWFSGNSVRRRWKIEPKYLHGRIFVGKMSRRGRSFVLYHSVRYKCKKKENNSVRKNEKLKFKFFLI